MNSETKLQRLFKSIDTEEKRREEIEQIFQDLIWKYEKRQKILTELLTKNATRKDLHKRTILIDFQFFIKTKYLISKIFMNSLL